MGHLTSHLTVEDFVDLAEGARDDASMPHLAVCGVCRRQLDDLREMVSVGASGHSSDVPEPSPLFWDHLSSRVREAVGNEELPALEGWSFRSSVMGLMGPMAGRRVAVAAGAVACALVVVIAAALGSRGASPAREAPAAAPPIAQLEPSGQEPIAQFVPLGVADDPSLSLVADYGGTLDWDEMCEQMGVSPQAGMEASVSDLNSEERQELEKLLLEELARPAAVTDRS